MDIPTINSGKWSLAKRMGTIFMAVYFSLLMVDFIIGFEILPGFINVLFKPTFITGWGSSNGQTKTFCMLIM